MTHTHQSPGRPLRLWPAVVIVAAQWLLRFGVPLVAPEAMMVAIVGEFAGAAALLAWWLFFSRAPWPERIGALGLMAAALFATSFIVHDSISNGMMGMLLVIYAVPVLCLALVGWAVTTRRLGPGPRRAALVVSVAAACGGWALVRTGGITGDADSDFHWRWSRTPEERLLAQAEAAPPPERRPAPAVVPPVPAPAQGAEVDGAPVGRGSMPTGTEREVPASSDPAAPPSARPAPAALPAVAAAAWPGFRGSRRDGVVHGTRISTDWSSSPPVELWRRPIGPGWSSFAVQGDRLYTQEQRGDDEIVACYRVSTGEPVWQHRDAVRFWESNGGAGPRATPTLDGGRVYALGATGILNALDARTGAVAWSRNAAADTGKAVPDWGFSSSPLVVDDVVVVHAGRLVAYDRSTGERRWLGPERRGSYSSPHLTTIGGVEQILMVSGAGATSVAPADGRVLWDAPWPGAPIVQPAVMADGDILMTTASASGGEGTRRLSVTHGAGGWTVAERWTSRGLKPYFNDFVVHAGHAYGFDGSILACIDLASGERVWKGGRYGHGQLVLLADQDVLLVLSEDGELALVRAAPEGFTELATMPALDAKTWNHPVVVGDLLLIRNGEEMAAFRLPVAGR